MGNSYLDLKYRKVIAQGWPLLGDLSILANNFGAYWLENRGSFERLMQLLVEPVYPADAANPPKAFLNLYNLLSIAKGDLVVAVESAQGAGPVMGICQVEQNAWESYRHDDPYVYDYAHTVSFPNEWVDWEEIAAEPPRPPAMIPGVSPMGQNQVQHVQEVWLSYKTS
jgi:hypothetical protein